MNPFDIKSKSIDDYYVSMPKLTSKAYDKETADPYSKLRIILMNGTEFEAINFSHRFSRTCDNNDIRRALAAIRRGEAQQQKRISSLKPQNENILEHTIGYEHLAVDLTAELALKESNPYVKQALDFALLEDFDHLYRYADLLEMEQGVKAQRLVGEYAEIMPGRPTIAEHRHPYDSIKKHIDNKQEKLSTVLHIMTITAAEQQTMNYYMNAGAFYEGSSLGRELYNEIAMIEEQHVTHYGSLLDTKPSFLENLLMHEYCEAYLYYSCYNGEKDNRLKLLWEEFFEEELCHLNIAKSLLEKYGKISAGEVIPDGEFPSLIEFCPHKDYIRNILSNTVDMTADREGYAKVEDLPSDAEYFAYQDIVNHSKKLTPSHRVIEDYIAKKGIDYRYQIAEHPVVALQDRHKDNTSEILS